MHADHQVFLDAIAAKRTLSVRFFDRKKNKERVVTCAPLDFGPLRGELEPVDRYQLWDLEGKRKPLNLPILPADVVTMKSEVVFVDEDTGEEHRVHLVYPCDADIESNRLSVLTPVGAALIGLRRGDRIDWPNRLGASRRLRLVDVVQPGPDE